MGVGTLLEWKVVTRGSRSVDTLWARTRVTGKTDFYLFLHTLTKMVTLELIESLATLEDVSWYVDLGKGIIEDAKNAKSLLVYNARVINNWETKFLPALEHKKDTILKGTSRKRRRCHGCEHDLPGQREHMGGCLPDYDESWSD